MEWDHLIAASGHAFLRSAVCILPNFPRRLAAFVEFIQLLFVLKCIHGGKKAVIFKGGQLFFLDQASERLNYKLLSGLYVFENLPLQNEKSCIDSNAGLRELLEFQ